MDINNKTVDSKQYIVIKIAEEQYGIDIKFVDSIVVMQRITRIPKSQSYYKGVINLRGDIVPVMSLRSRFGLSEEEYNGKTRIVIIKPEGQASVGVIVDEVKEVVSINSTDIDQVVYEEKDEKAAFGTGVGKLGNELITLLNIVSVIIEKEAVNS
ncbi:MAG: CheW protein [Herbinix sp.]|jgi:purine-binding chemotaxis protein CheW|nr:CheW protein [Herbinix sp.]